MNIELICIGREILDGRITDTNKKYVGQKLSTHGLQLKYVQTVGDIFEDIDHCFQIAQSRSDIVLVTGGLGPTCDDISAEAFARFAKLEMVENKIARLELEVTFKKLQKPLNESQLKQARLPEGAQVISNDHGTAPGFSQKLKNTHWFFYPGVPSEMHPMLEKSVLKKYQQEKKLRSLTWSTIFSSEGNMQENLKTIQKNLSNNFSLSFHTHFPFNYVSLHEKASSDSTEKTWQQLESKIDQEISSVTFQKTENEADFLSLFLNKMKKEDFKLGAVESCTGGLISDLVTSTPGASEVFVNSWVTYANQAKIELGVCPEVIEKHGAVSKECVEEMLTCGIDKLREIYPNSDLACLATTGIAGPGGGSPQKPIGTCFLGYAVYGHESNELILSTEKAPVYKQLTRQKYKSLFAHFALYKLYKALA